MEQEYIPKPTDKEQAELDGLRRNRSKRKLVEREWHITIFNEAKHAANLKAIAEPTRNGSRYSELMKQEGYTYTESTMLNHIGQRFSFFQKNENDSQLVQFAQILPISLTTIYRLCKLPPNIFDECAKSGAINASMTVKDADALLLEYAELDSAAKKKVEADTENKVRAKEKAARDAAENSAAAAEKKAAAAEKRASDAEANAKKVERAAKKREEELSNSYTKEYQRRTELEDTIRSFNLDKLDLEHKIEELEIELMQAKARPSGSQESKEDKKESVRINNRIHAAQAELNELLEKIRKAQAETAASGNSKIDEEVAKANAEVIKAKAEAKAAREEAEQLKQQQQEKQKRKSRRKETLKAIQVVAESMLTGELLDDEQDLLDSIEQLRG